MTIVENWKEILTQAWSVRTGALSALFGGLQHAMPFIPAGLMGLTADQSAAVAGMLGGLSILFGAMVPVVRVFDQGLAK